MNKILLLISAFLIQSVMFQANGQNLSEDYNRLETLFVAKKLNEGLPYFERIFSGQDAELKMKAALFVQEKSLENPWVGLEPSWVEYLRIIAPLVADLQAKTRHDARDFYLNGLFHYILGQLGMMPGEEAYSMAFASFDEARYKGYPGAIVYLAKTAQAYQRYEPEVTDEFVLELSLAADQHTQKPDLLFDIVRTNMHLAYKHPHEDVMPDKKRNQEEIERALRLFTNGMVAIEHNFSDNFPKIVADLWIIDVFNRSSYASSIVNEPEADLLIKYFKEIPATSASEKTVNAYTYNYLFQLFILSNDANNTKAQSIVSEIEKINKNDLKNIRKSIIDFEETLLDDSFMSVQLGIRSTMGSYYFGKGKLLKM